jgi:hypothetical protein
MDDNYEKCLYKRTKLSTVNWLFLNEYVFKKTLALWKTGKFDIYALCWIRQLFGEPDKKIIYGLI